MFIVSINQELCTGCKSCTDVCPASLLGFDGTKAEVVGDESECMGCESCVTVCEAGAISIMET